MKAFKGALISCDPAVKQILLIMNEQDSFMIEDLDETHMVVKVEELERVENLLEAELEKNTYTLETQ